MESCQRTTVPTHPSAGTRPEMWERAIRLVAATIAEQGGERHGVVTRVARELGIGTESLSTWLR